MKLETIRATTEQASTGASIWKNNLRDYGLLAQT